MTLTERRIGNVVVLDFAGRLALGDATERLHDKINSLVQQDQRSIVMNLSRLDSMDSSGLGELVRSHSSVAARGGRVRLVNVAKRAYDLLVLTKLLTVFDVFDSEEAAVGSFST